MSTTYQSAKREVDAMLAGEPSRRALRLRIAAVERLQADIHKFVHWPAFEESLRRDALHLRAKMYGIDP